MNNEYDNEYALFNQRILKRNGDHLETIRYNDDFVLFIALFGVFAVYITYSV